LTTLAILNGDLEGTTYRLEKPTISLGRRTDNDVVLAADPRVSRFHAQLTQRGPEWLLEDLGSANGTFVGQRKIHGPTVVRPGDRFRMGRTWFSLAAEPVVTSEADALENVHLLGSEDLGLPGDVPLPENVVYKFAVDDPQVKADGAEAQRRLEVVRRVSASLASTLDLAQLLDVVIDSIMQVLPADAGFMMLVDRQTGDFIPRAIRRRSDGFENPQMNVSRHILEHAINERAAIMTADAMSDSRFENLDSVQNLQIRSAICAPMLHGEEALGTIFLESQSATGAFTQQDLELLMGIAGQAATAIENARLYTDLRQTFESLQAAHMQLVRSERLSTVGALSASIAHDMANVVTPLKPLMKLILRGHEVDPEALDSLNRQMDRLTALLERIMSFSKTADLQLEPVQVNDILPKTMTLIRSEINQRRVEMVLDLDDNLPTLMGDAAQLDRVFLNLALNALEAMEEGDERVLTIKTERDGEEVAISFTDTGPGISVDNQEKLFEPLFTTKHTGTGLGLHSCKRIVEEEHHGTIEVDSLEGIGATFTVRLPISQAAGQLC
jgi:signal transduction histidine kinase